jgi:hypothetical protein
MRTLALIFATGAALYLIAPTPSPAMPVTSLSKVPELAISMRGVERARYYNRPYYRPYLYRPYYWRYGSPYYYRPYGYYGSCLGCGWPFGW